METRGLSGRLFLYGCFAALGALIIWVVYQNYQRGPTTTSSPYARNHDKPVEQPTSAAANVADYKWMHELNTANLLANRIKPPKGFERVSPPEGTWEYWLQRLPLKPGRNVVHMYNGRIRQNSQHAAVIDLDVGNKDLQQCADSVIRLRAEYLLAKGRADAVSFNADAGWPIPWNKWALGERVAVRPDNSAAWRKIAQPDSSYANFRKYLDTVFKYAGTASLAGELVPVRDAATLNIGDVFITPGHPGHAVMVVDVAVNPKTAKKAFLLAQGFMPAQDMHVLKNLKDAMSPWYSADFGEKLLTPDWTFTRGDLKRFP